MNRWWYRLRVPTLTPHLRAQHHRHRGTRCKIISGNSQNFAKMLVSRKKIEKGQFSITIEEGSAIMRTACREYTHSRNFTSSRPRGLIRWNTKIGPVLDVKFYPHKGRYFIDIMIESLFNDRKVSWGSHCEWDRTLIHNHSIVVEVSKFMTRTLRHEPSTPREEDGVKIWRLDREIKGNFCEYFAMDSHNLCEFTGTRRRNEEKVSILLESFFIQ